MFETGPILLTATAALALLAASAFFSSAEIAIFSLAPDWIDDAAAGGDRRARTLATLRGDPHRLLVTLLVGNNLVNVALTSIVALAVGRVLPPGEAVVAATLLATTVVLLFGEVLPKSLGLGHAGTWALVVARPIAYLQLALYPVVAVFDAVAGWFGALLGGDRDIEQPYAE